MFVTERIIASLGIVWAVVSLVIQVIQSRRHSGKNLSVQAGSPLKGIIYNFTWAMTPAHKETIRKHPIEFTIGLLMHIGVFISVIRAVIEIINPSILQTSSGILGIYLVVAAICGLILLVKRIASKDLRPISTPDDYISILITILFLLSASAQSFGIINAGVFLIVTTVLFFYMPLGKLRHAVFFFVVRADYGASLGYKGTYPAK